MSISVMAEVWKDAPVAGTELLMLLALADSANDDRECWPSLAHLQHKVRLSRVQTQRLLKSLERNGLIEIEKNGGKGKNGQKTNRYRLRYPTSIAHDTPPTGQTGIAGDTLNRNLEPSENPETPDGGSVPENTKKPRPPHPNEPWRNELLRCFGLTPETVTKTGDRVYWIAAADLVKINFPVEKIKDFHRWCVDQEWKNFGVMALAKHAGEWLAKQTGDDDDPYATMFSDENLVKVPK